MSSTLARSARERSPIAKIYLVTYLSEKFGSRETVRPHHRANNVKSHTFQLVWGPATFIASPSCDELTAVKTVSADQNQMTASWAQMSTHRGYVSFFFLTYPLASYWFLFVNLLTGASLLPLVKHIY